MMTPAEKATKAKEILNSNPSEDDTLIAVGLAKEAAEANDPYGLCLVGQLYYYGTGVEKDYKKSFDLCQKALAAGEEKAKVILAIFYTLGNVVERDLPLAEQYLRDRMAADDGFAYFIMGDFVFQNAFPDIEWSTFVDYFKKAIDLGETVVMVRLADKYNLICEPEQADYWYQQAAEAGAPDVEESKAQFTEENYDKRRQNILTFYINTGKYDKAIALVNRDLATGDESARWPQAGIYAQGMGNEAYGRDLPKALALYEQLADEDEPHAYFILGHLYYNAEEIKDPQKALYYMQKAADAEHPDALFFMATNYLKDPEVGTTPEYDFGLETNEELGMQMLQKAAEEDQSNAMFSMSLCYYHGKHTEQDYEQAFALVAQSMEQEATAGKARLLADMYMEGKGVEQNYKRAAAYYQYATDNGDFEAASKLAGLYKEGKGVEQNAQMALRLVLRSNELMRWQLFGIMPLTVARNEAAKGDPAAMFQIGNRYQEGDGVEQNMEKAVEWWKKADEKGHTDATYNLGVYYQGQEDLPNAVKYLEKAISQGSIAACHILGSCYLRHDDVEGNVQKGMDLLETAAQKGYAESQLDLARIYNSGTFGTRDIDKCRYWLEKSVEANYPMAHYAMAYNLAHDDGLYPKDTDKALVHFRRAIELGCHDADADYINLRWYGNGAEVDREEVISVYKQLAEKRDAVAWYNLYYFYHDDVYEHRDNNIAADYLQRSADAGYVVALYEMGVQHMEDGIFPTDHKKAFQYFTQAAEMGHIEAHTYLGCCYLSGTGTDKDVHKAVEMLTPAAEAGSRHAIHFLAGLYLYGEKGELQPDYDKAIALLQPYLESEDSEIDYLMGLALHHKNSMKNAYSWDLASQAFEHMKKAAEAGYTGAMDHLSFWYLCGTGVFADAEEAKNWVQKCLDNGGTISDSNYPEWYSDEKYDDYVAFCNKNYWKELAENNIDRIENALEMEDSEGNPQIYNILLNVVQIGELNAISTLVRFGLNALKTEPENAKTYISAVCKAGLPNFAAEAAEEWLKDGLDNDTAVEKAVEYYSMGMEAGSADCFLGAGLLLTDEHLDGDAKDKEKAIASGINLLQVVINSDDEEYEELRQKARARLTEIEQRKKSEPKSAWSKIKKGLGAIFTKD